MLNKQKETLLKYCEWLEKYLNPTLSPFEYKRLFQDGAKLLKTFEKIDSESPLLKQIEKTNEKQYPDNILDYIKLEADPYASVEYYDNECINGPDDLYSQDITYFMFFKRDVYFLLKELKNSSLPWNRALADHQQTRFVSYSLQKNYSKLYFTVRSDSGEIKKVTSFFVSEEKEGTKNSIIRFNRKTSVDLNEAYQVIVSRIFFDFLFMGGINHFIFCNQCQRFTTVRRQGKMYCSDICRTTSNSN